MPLIADSISFRYPRGPLVLDGVSCAIEPGAVTAIVGPNGAGKSTLVRVLGGLRSPGAGRVWVDGAPLGSLSPRARAQRVAFLEQRPSMAFDFTVRRVVSFGAFSSGRGEGPVDEALARFGLKGVASSPFVSLSVGQQQRASFARAWVQIAGRAGGYLLADEPCSAMDPRHAMQTMGAMRALASGGAGVAVVVHDLNLAMRFADRCIVLDAGGRVAAAGGAGEALDAGVLTGVFGVEIERVRVEGHGEMLVVGEP